MRGEPEEDGGDGDSSLFPSYISLSDAIVGGELEAWCRPSDDIVAILGPGGAAVEEG